MSSVSDKLHLHEVTEKIKGWVHPHQEPHASNDNTSGDSASGLASHPPQQEAQRDHAHNAAPYAIQDVMEFDSMFEKKANTHSAQAAPSDTVDDYSGKQQEAQRDHAQNAAPYAIQDVMEFDSIFEKKANTHGAQAAPSGTVDDHSGKH